MIRRRICLSDPVNCRCKFGKKLCFFNGLWIVAHNSYLTALIECSIACGAIAYTFPKIGIFPLEVRLSSHRPSGKNKSSGLESYVRGVDTLAVTLYTHHKDLSSMIVCTAINSLVPHQVKQHLTVHRFVHTRIIGNYRCPRQRSNGRTLVHDHCLVLGTGSIESTSASSWATAHNCNITLHFLRRLHHEDTCHALKICTMQSALNALAAMSLSVFSAPKASTASSERT
mmetsp:Transcript_102218/g.177337  ORF Transcript_102218/g.177337 Transcript_102218/m.177337 type:complete len:228 (+) Transcript_102218:260-943(+)